MLQSSRRRSRQKSALSRAVRVAEKGKGRVIYHRLPLAAPATKPLPLQAIAKPVCERWRDASSSVVKVASLQGSGHHMQPSRHEMQQVSASRVGKQTNQEPVKNRRCRDRPKFRCAVSALRRPSVSRGNAWARRTLAFLISVRA
jgi:hypothetical protein